MDIDVGLTLLCLFMINMFASLVQGVASFGDAIVFHTLWEIAVKLAPDVLHSTILGSNDVELVVLLQYSRMIVVTAVLYHLTKGGGFSKELFLLLSVPQGLVSILGVFLLANSTGIFLRVFLGVFCLLAAVAVGIIKWVTRKKPFPDDVDHIFDPQTGRLRPNIFRACLLGSLASGITGSIVGVAAPPIMFVLLYYNFPSAIVRPTFPASVIPGAFLRFGYAVATELITADEWPFHAATVFGGVVGMLVGASVGRRISNDLYVVVASVVTLLASFAILPIPATALVAVCLLGCCIIAVAAIKEA